ncbi:hypothetical protein [Pedobacter xixiisoli]|uniref:Uncharacterized protein n=1 Tax=Pedobacter xixiisoli TaxID=1476464 RepID=A0A285ZYL1_9SPHI|nr:hypothetical protein [Pedobacter xixiisoli]SOD14697.1 hypothetical protein SAMN06297358_1706 [Pedobacter xixiisoli]
MDLKDWKLKLRYGKIKTPYKHFTIIGNCEVGNLIDEFSCRPGPAYVSMKVWTLDYKQAAEIFSSVGNQIGFTPYDDVEIYDSEAVNPPKEDPFAYDINFTPYAK